MSKTIANQQPNASNEQIFHLSVKAIIHNQHGKILLLRRPKARDWDLPGGRINTNEDPLDALIREVKEETGLTELQQLQAHTIELTSVVTTKQIDGQYPMILIWYHTCFVNNDTITLSHEHDTYVWVHWHEARTMIAPLGQSEHINQHIVSYMQQRR